MPLYEYQCDKCAHRFEIIQRFSDPPADTCPACGGPVHKLLSSPAIQFKGSGWYVTDYARKDAPGTPAKDGSTESAAPKASTPADAKPSSGSTTESSGSPSKES